MSHLILMIIRLSAFLCLFYRKLKLWSLGNSAQIMLGISRHHVFLIFGFDALPLGNLNWCQLNGNELGLPSFQVPKDQREWSKSWLVVPTRLAIHVFYNLFSLCSPWSNIFRISALMVLPLRRPVPHEEIISSIPRHSPGAAPLSSLLFSDIQVKGIISKVMEKVLHLPSRSHMGRLFSLWTWDDILCLHIIILFWMFCLEYLNCLIHQQISIKYHSVNIVCLKVAFR